MIPFVKLQLVLLQVWVVQLALELLLIPHLEEQFLAFVQLLDEFLVLLLEIVLQKDL